MNNMGLICVTHDPTGKNINLVKKFGPLLNKIYFNTHPIEWVETEKITNKIFSLELGQEADVTAGSSGFSRQSAQLISDNSKDKMTDAEWAMIVYRIGKMKVGYKAVEGLEYREDVREFQKNNKPASGLFCAMLHCHNPYIAQLCSGYGASPDTKYPQNLWLVIFFQLPKWLYKAS
jgi:hypothetical protein